MDLHCPACKQLLDTHFAIDLSDDHPKLGDIIFCGHCRMISYVESVDPYVLRVMPDAEIAKLSEEFQEELKFAAKIHHARHSTEN